MSYCVRKIDKYLENWKNKVDKNPLIVKGARQIGKTEAIRHFAMNNYESVVEINFVEEPIYKGIIENGFKADEIIKLISLIDPSKRFISGNTLIFFDELQDFPEISTALKFFKIDGRFDVICSGSLLGINYKQISSNSVGYQDEYQMHGFDFEEYLWAKGYGDDISRGMLQHMIELKPFSNIELGMYQNLFLDYCMTGGMPAVINKYLFLGTFEGSLETQKQLMIGYKNDIRKYANGVDQTRIMNVFNQIAPQLAKENKKFQISKVAKGARFKDYRGCIEWLNDSGLINICYGLNFPELPLKGNYNDSKYKLYFFDTGLLISELDEEAQMDLRGNKNFGVYKGALYENIVAEAMIKQGYSLYYYKRDDSTLEQDFFVRDKDSLIPVEVKATNGTAKSLNTLINSDKYADVKYGIKFVKGNIGFENEIYTFPYFCAFLLKEWLRGEGR